MNRRAFVIPILLGLVVFATVEASAFLQGSGEEAEAPYVPSWLSIVREQTYSMVVTPETTVDYYCDHCGSTIPLERAESWHGEGRDVEGIRVSLLQEGVAYHIQLGLSDELGPFEYIIGVQDAEDSIYIHFVPGSAAANVTHTTDTTYEDIALVTGEYLAQGANWIAGFISYDVITPFISRSHLGLIRFDFHMAKNTENNREQFVFDIAGWATKL